MNWACYVGCCHGWLSVFYTLWYVYNFAVNFSQLIQKLGRCSSIRSDRPWTASDVRDTLPAELLANQLWTDNYRQRCRYQLILAFCSLILINLAAFFLKLDLQVVSSVCIMIDLWRRIHISAVPQINWALVINFP